MSVPGKMRVNILCFFHVLTMLTRIILKKVTETMVPESKKGGPVYATCP